MCELIGITLLYTCLNAQSWQALTQETYRLGGKHTIIAATEMVESCDYSDLAMIPFSDGLTNGMDIETNRNVTVALHCKDK